MSPTLLHPPVVSRLANVTPTRRAHEDATLAQARRVLEGSRAALQHEINTPLGALASASDSLARVVERCRRTLSDDAPLEHSDLVRALGPASALCDVIDESSQRIAGVVRGLDRALGAGGVDPAGLEGLEVALRLVEHDGRMRTSASTALAHAAASPAPRRSRPGVGGASRGARLSRRALSPRVSAAPPRRRRAWG